MPIPKPFLWEIENRAEKIFANGTFSHSHFPKLEKHVTENHGLLHNSRFQNKIPNGELGKTEVFENEHGEKFLGLAFCSVFFSAHGKPIFFVDNHHEVLLPLAHVFLEHEKKLTVVHFDAHRDDAIFPHEISPFSPENFLETTKKIQDQCRVSDYLDAAKKLGMVEKIVSVTQSFEAKKFSVPTESFVFNWDLDIFSEEGNAMPLDAKISVLVPCLQKADAIFVATSPGFFHHTNAMKVWEIFLLYHNF